MHGPSNDPYDGKFAKLFSEQRSQYAIAWYRIGFIVWNGPAEAFIYSSLYVFFKFSHLYRRKLWQKRLNNLKTERPRFCDGGFMPHISYQHEVAAWYHYPLDFGDGGRQIGYMV